TVTDFHRLPPAGLPAHPDHFIIGHRSVAAQVHKTSLRQPVPRSTRHLTGAIPALFVAQEVLVADAFPDPHVDAARQLARPERGHLDHEATCDDDRSSAIQRAECSATTPSGVPSNVRGGFTPILS